MQGGAGERGESSLSSHRPLSACCFFSIYFLIIIFDQLSILSRVVNSINKLKSIIMLGIHRPEGKLNCSRSRAIIIAGKAFPPVDNYFRRSY